MPESFTKGQPIAQLQGQELNCFGAAARVHSSSASRARRSATILPAHRHGRRRHLHRPLAAHRGDQPRPGPHVHEHRHARISGRPSMGSWVTYGLGSEARRPARLRRADLAGQRRPGRSRSPRGSGTAASCPAGSRASQFRSQGRPGAVRAATRAGVDARSSSATSSTPCNALEPAAARRGRRPGDRHAHRPVRDGLPHADRACPALMDLSERAGSTCSSCTAPSGATARSPPTACWPGGWPSAACASSSSTTATGTITATSSGDIAGTAEEVDQAAGRADPGPQAARHARRHARSSGAASSAARRWPRATGRDHHIKGFSMWLAGGGIKRRHHLRRDRRARLQRRRERRSTSTTCTPRCCTCWASTTRS